MIPITLLNLGGIIPPIFNLVEAVLWEQLVLLTVCVQKYKPRLGHYCIIHVQKVVLTLTDYHFTSWPVLYYLLSISRKS
jgi:hypothetical protein